VSEIIFASFSLIKESNSRDLKILFYLPMYDCFCTLFLRVQLTTEQKFAKWNYRDLHVYFFRKTMSSFVSLEIRFDEYIKKFNEIH
jgi:hypothetical protein